MSTNLKEFGLANTGEIISIKADKKHKTLTITTQNHEITCGFEDVEDGEVESYIDVEKAKSTAKATGVKITDIDKDTTVVQFYLSNGKYIGIYSSDIYGSSYKFKTSLK